MHLILLINGIAMRMWLLDMPARRANRTRVENDRIRQQYLDLEIRAAKEQWAHLIEGHSYEIHLQVRAVEKKAAAPVVPLRSAPAQYSNKTAYGN